MNIRKEPTALEASVRALCAVVQNPAVRQVTDWNMANKICSANGRLAKVAGFDRSRSQKAAVPPTIKNTVIKITSLE